MTVEEVVKYLRMNVSIQDPSITTSDSAYLSMSDDDIKAKLQRISESIQEDTTSAIERAMNY